MKVARKKSLKQERLDAMFSQRHTWLNTQTQHYFKNCNCKNSGKNLPSKLKDERAQTRQRVGHSVSGIC